MGLFTKGLAFQAGMRATEKGDHKTALENFVKAGNLGHPDACYNAAVCYAQGKGTGKDLDKALAWAKLAKENKSREADKLIRQIQALQKQAAQPKDTTPKPAPKPAPKAKTDEELSPEEQYQKGMELFRTGDYDGAYAFLRRVCRAIGAHKNDYPDGQAAMGWMYEHGCGVEVAEDGMAHRHYEIAARNGDKDGMAGFVRLTAKMEMPGVSECQTALDYARRLGISEAKKAVSALEQKLAEAQLREKYAELDLNEDNVKAIFNRCLATEDSKDLVGPILFSQKNGFPKDSEPVVFDKAQILKNEKNIDYLFGQLRDVRSSRHEFTLSSVAVNYHGELWTQDSGIILSFLHLGYANHLFNSFVRISSGDYAYVPFINLTLSPKDPNFPAWWEKHRAEWEALIQTEPQPHGK